MPEIPFTDEQRRAIQSVGRDVVVSAAAGAGKTAVLAERCAFLVCDAPPPHRCDADALLVLTFTEAAAAEMRERVVAAIRCRAHDRPADHRLREQAARVGAAQISTIHSFCLTLIRRWFTELDVDPAGTVMDEHESRLLRREILDRLFTRLYEQARITAPTHDQPDLPRPGVHGSGSRSTSAVSGDGNGHSTPSWRSFSALVDDYGLGDDRAIGEFVLAVHAFTRSLPDPESWLSEAADFDDRRMGVVLRRYAAAALEELELQHEHLDSLLADRRATPAFEPRAFQPIESYRQALEHWRDLLRCALNGPGHELASVFDGLGQQAAEFKFPRAASRRKTDPPDVLTALDIAKGDLGSMRECFRKRLANRFLRFRWRELLSDARRTAPHVRAVVDLVSAFEREYTDRKRALGLLDFADLERMAFRLLHGTDASGVPNAAVVSLRRRFAQVLVDEFQDINPLQLAIITLASRDVAGGGNLFVVGDVKQSIYRFRLAEPALFVDWARRLGDSPDRGDALSLRTNFRSRAGVIDAVNAVFRVLMAHSEMPYDETAELRCGRVVTDNAPRAPVEIHVLESRWPSRRQHSQKENESDSKGEEGHFPDDESDTEDADTGWQDSSGVADAKGPGRWTREEREAYVIASRIQAWRDTGESVVEGRAPRPDEIAVLLRSPRHTAERMAAMLRRLGVPAVAEAGASLLSTVEVRDVLSALRLLDNAAQDIPLASVLRSGVLGERLAPRELARVRMADRESPFHEAARTYARRGEDDALRRRLAEFFRRTGQWRDTARRRPLSELVDGLLDGHGHLARAGATSNGAQRIANLLRLHEIARAFGGFRRQGLRRFLEFIDAMAREDRDIDVGAACGDAHGAVRIMSVHKAKGLEFPVVFLAGLGRNFNQEDVRGRMLFERRSKIGLRVVDPANLIEHPSVLHRLAVAETEQSARDEEMRVLYVGMTRARDRLVLLGSTMATGADQVPAALRRSTRLDLMTASSPLDWLQAVLAIEPAGTSTMPIADPASSTVGGAVPSDKAAFHVSRHSSADMDAWRRPSDFRGDSDELLRATARFEALPPGEPVAIESAAVNDLFNRLDYAYPFLSVSSVPATIAASAFTGPHDPARSEASPLVRFEGAGDFHWSPRSRRNESAAPWDATGVGIVTHKALQHLDLATSPSDVASELQRLVREARLNEQEALAVDADSIAWFLGTELARRMRDAGSDYRRETMFIASESPTALDVAVETGPGDFVLVRGIVDGILATPEGLEVVDFKTDRVAPGALAGRAERYAPQLRLYARAVARLWRRPVTRCTLVFLAAQEFATVEL